MSITTYNRNSITSVVSAIGAILSTDPVQNWIRDESGRLVRQGAQEVATAARGVIRRISTGPSGRQVRQRTEEPPEEPTAAPSQSNSTRMASSGGEVPVIPPPKRVSKIVPDYFTIVLPYAETFRDGSNPVTTNLERYFRLNSIFDPDLTGTGHQPKGRDTWANVYQYYRVLSTEVTITWQNLQDAPFTGETQIVGFELTDKDEDAISTGQLAFIEGKQTAPLLLPGINVAGANMQTQTYTYSPDTWHYHVQETGVEERWTPMGQNPTNTHLICLRAFRHNFGHTVTARKLQYLITLNYKVQFRETTNNILRGPDN